MTNSLLFFLATSLVLLFGFTPQSHQNKKACKALYYGMGNGDGVLDRRCFRLQSQLSQAAYAGDLEKIKKLLRNGANADSSAGEYLPPLYGAAVNGKTEAARILLETGANINRKYTLNGPPLFAAVYGNHAETVDLLVSRGADVNIRNGSDTALKIARAKGYVRVAALLESAGARE